MEQVKSFLVGNKVKRTQYAHEISLSLLSLALSKHSNVKNNIYIFEAWKEQLSIKSPKIKKKSNT